MKNHSWTGRAIGAALLAGSLGACDFIGISSEDPNIITEPTMPSLFVSAQVNSYLFAEGQLARVGAVFTQQLAGADRQYSLLDTYVIDEETGEDEFGAVFTGAGLVDIRNGRAIADSFACPQCEALFQIHEAFMVGQAASIFGDLPYRGALVEGTPAALDPQAQVYADVQALLDEAIASLATAPATGVPTGAYNSLAAVDLNFAGNRGRWAAVANTLKARFYLHWVEAQRAGGAAAQQALIACGGNCINKAEAATALGITATAGDLRGQHSTAGPEQNIFFQFFRDRSGYAVAGNYLVELMKSRNDPRLPRYFSNVGTVASPNYRGSRPGQNLQAASVLATTPTVGVGASDYDQPIVTCAENHFINAEVNYYQGDEGPARTALKAAVRCAEAMHGLAAGSILTAAYEATIDGLSGQALLTEIMTQKYISLFLNIEVYNDYKRTCLPRLTTYQGKPIPARLFYGQQERQTNPNIPPPDQQPDFNTNDPVRCT